MLVLCRGQNIMNLMERHAVNTERPTFVDELYERQNIAE